MALYYIIQIDQISSESHEYTVRLYPVGARRSKQSILKKINLEYSLKGLLLKLQYFDYLMQRVNSLEKTLMLKKIESRRRIKWQMLR